MGLAQHLPPPGGAQRAWAQRMRRLSKHLPNTLSKPAGLGQSCLLSQMVWFVLSVAARHREHPERRGKEETGGGNKSFLCAASLPLLSQADLKAQE